VSGRGRRAIWGGLLAIAVIGAIAPASASAAECDFNVAKAKLKITDTTAASLIVEVEGSAIELHNPGPVTCSGATVNNVDKIVVKDDGPAGQAFSEVAIRDPELFAPGATDAGDTGANPDEIEWKISMASPHDVMSYSAEDDPDGTNIRVGANGVNHDVGGGDKDVDVKLKGADNAVFQGGNQSDVFSGAGGKGTGSPTKLQFRLPTADYGVMGVGGDDVLTGGLGNDFLTGDYPSDIPGEGADKLIGGGGRDTLDAQDGLADLKINCGTGKDKAKIDAGVDPSPKSC
jgi:RTX calcium-binding nonapeptide repeat (4 copies)